MGESIGFGNQLSVADEDAYTTTDGQGRTPSGAGKSGYYLRGQSGTRNKTLLHDKTHSLLATSETNLI